MQVKRTPNLVQLRRKPLGCRLGSGPLLTPVQPPQGSCFGDVLPLERETTANSPSTHTSPVLHVPPLATVPSNESPLHHCPQGRWGMWSDLPSGTNKVVLTPKGMFPLLPHSAQHLSTPNISHGGADPLKSPQLAQPCWFSGFHGADHPRNIGGSSLMQPSRNGTSTQGHARSWWESSASLAGCSGRW